jgi:hypothetical protein
MVLGCKENPDCFDATCFFDKKQTKGVVYACFTSTTVGLAPLPFKGDIGWGVEKTIINLLLTFMKHR